MVFIFKTKLNMSKKLSVSLGLREKVEKDFTNMLADMLRKFDNKQTMFMGLKNTFEALEGEPDMPENRKFQSVASTVSEQLSWFVEHSKDYFDTVLSIEKTNATGISAELVVKGVSWGKYTTTELMRAKSILDSKLRTMISKLPIRSETQLWEKTTSAEFAGRDIWETPIDRGFTKTTTKRIEIINDPHIKDAPGRAPMTQQIDTPKNTGKYTKQSFSGEVTNRERALMEVRLNDIHKGIIEALENANNAEVVPSNLGDKILGHLFK
jgi:hypothetical protein